MTALMCWILLRLNSRAARVSAYYMLYAAPCTPSRAVTTWLCSSNQSCKSEYLIGLKGIILGGGGCLQYSLAPDSAQHITKLVACQCGHSTTSLLRPRHEACTIASEYARYSPAQGRSAASPHNKPTSQQLQPPSWRAVRR